MGQSYPLQSHPLENVDDDVDCCLEEDAVCRICWGEREDSEGVFFVTFQSPMSSMLLYGFLSRVSSPPRYNDI